MSDLKAITIVGGGLAGLTLGIGLRQLGVPVTLWEAGRFPRHRVCGEFISGRGQETLERLGLRELLLQGGAQWARTAVFCSEEACGCKRALPQPALCLSRWQMDAILAQEFRTLGGELRENAPWRDATFGEGVVRATGRRAQPVVGGWRWCGFKAHATGVTLAADLEMHLRPEGYVGLCGVEGGRVNVCGLFRRAVAATDAPVKGQELLRGSEGSPLRARMASAHFEAESFCAVAGLALAPQRAVGRDEWVLGDALTMIPPITGNGMSMAFEAAEATLPPLFDYSRGLVTWANALRRLAGHLDACFASRLAWARLLQGLVFQSRFRRAILPRLLQSRWLFEQVFTRTR